MDELSQEWMALKITKRPSVFAEIEAACLRRGMSLDQLVTDGLAHAVLGDRQNSCVTVCDACRPAS